MKHVQTRTYTLYQFRENTKFEILKIRESCEKINKILDDSWIGFYSKLMLSKCELSQLDENMKLEESRHTDGNMQNKD
jgi:hypothetical protein